jgi:ferredoxin
MLMPINEKLIERTKSSLSSIISCFERTIEAKEKWLETSKSVMKNLKDMNRVLCLQCSKCEHSCKLFLAIKEATELVLKLSEIA